MCWMRAAPRPRRPLTKPATCVLGAVSHSMVMMKRIHTVIGGKNCREFYNPHPNTSLSVWVCLGVSSCLPQRSFSPTSNGMPTTKTLWQPCVAPPRALCPTSGRGRYAAVIRASKQSISKQNPAQRSDTAIAAAAAPVATQPADGNAKPSLAVDTAFQQEMSENGTWCTVQGPAIKSSPRLSQHAPHQAHLHHRPRLLLCRDA